MAEISSKMATIHTFEEMDCWKEARNVSKQIGMLVKQGRFGKSFRLTGQIEAAVGSVMDNIAEGFERGSRGEFIQFLGYAKGSCGEVRSQLYRAFDWNYLNAEEFEQLKKQLLHISSMLQRMIRYLQISAVSGNRRR